MEWGLCEERRRKDLSQKGDRYLINYHHRLLKPLPQRGKGKEEDTGENLFT